MRIVRTKAELRELRRPEHGFVPTMGAFHEGHLHLMRTAKEECGGCLASLFVNPTQFGPNEDFGAYPRDEASDFSLAESAGVDLLFAPDPIEIYGEETVSITVPKVAKRWEGEHRPRHFEGVATVVAKLFHLSAAKTAYFGLKDFQQCAVIRQMSRGLDFEIDLRFVETVREADGLAMSSRNRYLSSEEREKAPHIYQQLLQLREDLRSEGHRPRDLLEQAAISLKEVGFRVDYLALVDSRTLEPTETIAGDSRLIVAAWIGRTRLIDNCAVYPSVMP